MDRMNKPFPDEASLSPNSFSVALPGLSGWRNRWIVTNHFKRLHIYTSSEVPKFHHSGTLFDISRSIKNLHDLLPQYLIIYAIIGDHLIKRYFCQSCLSWNMQCRFTAKTSSCGIRLHAHDRMIAIYFHFATDSITARTITYTLFSSSAWDTIRLRQYYYLFYYG